jgi:hypothetical protein
MLQESPAPNSFTLKMETAYSSELSEQTFLHGLRIKKPSFERFSTFSFDFNAPVPVIAPLFEVDAEVL